MGNIQESVDVQPVHREDFHGEKRIRTQGEELGGRERHQHPAGPAPG